MGIKSDQNSNIESNAIIEENTDSSILDIFSDKDVPFPGQLNDEFEVKKSISNYHVTKLGFVSVCETDITENETSQIADLVEEFKLDPNHDYSKHISASRYDCYTEFKKNQSNQN